MSTREPDNSQLRDTLLAKLMAESLASSSAALGANCPDAETIAAYAERNLSSEEIGRLDLHFADCGRCQTVLAALVRSLDSLPASSMAESPAEISWPTLANIPPQNMARPAKSPISATDASQSSASASKIRPLIKAVPPPQPTRWSELAPALGVAAVIALWFALRPAPATQNLSAQLRTDAETAATQLPTAQAPALSNKDIAKPNIAGANVAAAPATSPVTPTQPAPNSPSPQESQQLSANVSASDAQEDALKKSATAEETANARATALGGTSAGLASRKELQASQSAPAPSTPTASLPSNEMAQTFSATLRAPLAAAPAKAAPPQPPGGVVAGAAPTASITPAADRAKPAVAIATLTNPATVTVTGDLPRVNTGTAQLGGTLAPSSPGQLPVEPRNYPYLLSTAPAQLGTSAQLRAASSAPISPGETDAKSVGLAATSGAISAPGAPIRTPAGTGLPPSIVFASPSGNVLWRIGAAGNIERSEDRGRNWQRESSAVTGEMLAGAAASDQSAWIVGRGGVIMYSADGKTWQRISLPAALTANLALDFTTVQTSGALRATITAAGGRRFSTVDGGKTWTAQ